jgi:polyisoprenyl-teichoic acid--peptidoglycan teichoic acid transferase
VYRLKGPNGKRYGAYRIVARRGRVGEYYGVQGLTWKHPPILEKTPHDKVRMGRRDFEVHYDGDRVRLVAWRTDKAVYWVSNTLLLTLTKRQMLSIARSTRTL